MNLYKFAQATEESGVSFYQELADKAEDDGVKRIFTMFAADEKQQLKKLERMLQHYPKLAKMNCGRLEKNGIVFDQLRKSINADNIHSDLEAYQLAHQAEKKVIEQYLKAAEAESRPAVKKFLQWLAALEQHELKEIQQLLDFVSAPSTFLEWGEFSNLDEFHNFGRYEDLRQGDLDTPTVTDKLH